MQGSAVLVHGSWSHPEEWRWVIERLTPLGVEVAEATVGLGVTDGDYGGHADA